MQIRLIGLPQPHFLDLVNSVALFQQIGIGVRRLGSRPDRIQYNAAKDPVVTVRKVDPVIGIAGCYYFGTVFQYQPENLLPEFGRFLQTQVGMAQEDDFLYSQDFSSGKLFLLSNWPVSQVSVPDHWSPYHHWYTGHI
jgi:hypothetical protein